MKRLLVGYKASDLTDELLAGDTVCHVLDIYYAHAIEKIRPGAKVACSAHLPKDDWDEIFFRTGPKLMSGELSLDLLQEIHLLAPRRFKLDFVGRERDRNDLLAKIKDDPGRVRNFAARWPASVPGGGKLMFTSFPGCFCHRRLDEGGLALAEVVSKELAARNGVKLLDMGCGCGLVGLLVADAVGGVDLTMIDSHTRAVEAAELNARNFSIPANVLLADDGIASVPDAAGTFDVFVGNPPYYSDYRIAEVFLETAVSALKPGGVCYTVVKNDAGLKPVQERYFPSVSVSRRRGYCVLKSVKP
jgi:16S rRNA (guanine1207-N2)-methyltransferase